MNPDALIHGNICVIMLQVWGDTFSFNRIIQHCLSKTLVGFLFTSHDISDSIPLMPKYGWRL